MVSTQLAETIANLKALRQQIRRTMKKVEKLDIAEDMLKYNKESINKLMITNT